MSERVSIREFSRQVGVSDTAIRKAIASGRITSDAVVKRESGRPELILEIALRDWQSVTSGKELQKRQEQLTDKPSARRKNYPKDQVGSTAPPQTETHSAGSGVSYAEAKRQAAIFDAKMKGLELAEKQGMLVNKDKVYKALFAAGQEMRNALQSVPDRHIDQILAAKNRNEAHTLLYNAISDCLDKLADISQRELAV